MVVLVILVHVEVDGALAFVGIAVLQNLLHQFDLFDDVSRGLRLNAGRQDVEGAHGVVVAVGVILCHFHRLQLFQAGFLGYLVLAFVGIVFQMAHVGDIAHIAHLIAQVLEVAEQQVERDGRACVSQMRVAVDGGAADVHPHVGGVQGFENFFLPVQGVVDE